MIHIANDVGATFKASQLEQTNVGLLLLPDEEMFTEGKFGNSSVPLGQEEASSSRPVSDVSPTDGDKGKGVVDEGEKKGSNMDPYDLKMIDEGLTQNDVSMERGSRTIMIPMDRDLL